MDAGNFPTYEKIINTTPLPRTRQANGVFLLEVSFSPSEQTTSLGVPMDLEFGAFGDVCRIVVSGWSSRHTSLALTTLMETLGKLDPKGEAEVDASQSRLTLTFMENPAARRARVFGTLVFNPEGILTALLAPLK
jgi:hypothetical protein